VNTIPFKPWKRPLFLLGAALALLAGLLAGAGLAHDLAASHPGVRAGMWTYMVVPPFIGAGLALLAADVLLYAWRRQRSGQPLDVWGEWGLSIQRLSRWTLGLGLGLGGLLALGAGLFSWRAYHYVESVPFCGQLCHVPMTPQFTAHRDSGHANVSCVECHVGPGIKSFIRAKVSGLRQLQQIALNTFPRPIRAAEEHIPAADGTCKRCHWEDKHWGTKSDGRVRYGYDMENSARYLELQLPIGGGTSAHGVAGGIHQHMLRHKLLFRPSSANKQEIAQFTVVDDDGSRVVYDLYAKGERKYSESSLEAFPEQAMDCRDCHNRPAHPFLTPDETVDRALEAGSIERSLPSIKKVAIATLTREYSRADEAAKGIANDINTYYADHFGGKVLERQAVLDKAIAAVQAIYSRNVYPEMQIAWHTYPDNTGHRTAPGCFRCHEGKHVRRDTRQPLASKCEVCHRFYEKSREPGSLLATAPDNTLLHPFTHKEHFNQEISCWDCHAAANPYSQCKSCHQKEFSTDKMIFECSMCHRPPLQKVTAASCQPCHPTAASALHAHKDHANCLACHKPHQWKAETRHESCASAACHKPEDLAKWGDHGLPKDGCKSAQFKGVERLMNGLPTGPAPGRSPSAAAGAPTQPPSPAVKPEETKLPR
jgi:hypothetical protein